MKNMIFTGEIYADVVDRIEGALEGLIAEHVIIGVSITAATHGLGYYAGSIFYTPRAK